MSSFIGISLPIFCFLLSTVGYIDLANLAARWFSLVMEATPVNFRFEDEFNSKSVVFAYF